MADESTFTRRNVLKSGAAAATGLAGIGTASAEERPLEDARQIPCLDMTDRMDAFEPVDAASVAPERSSGIGPGSFVLITRGGTTAGCTANFVWEAGDGSLYLGAAGHCFLPGNADAETNAGGSFDASDVQVQVCVDCATGGATGLNGIQVGRLVDLGDVVYARQALDGVQVGEDFGLVEIPQDVQDQNLIDSSMPKFDGPSTVGTLEAGETTCHYGNAVAFGETFLTKGRTGAGLATNPETGVWRAATASAQGDSGAAVQTCQPTATGFDGSEAIGALTHLSTNGPVAGTTIEKAKTMVSRDAGLDIDPRLS
jgi:hypothetical protein